MWLYKIVIGFLSLFLKLRGFKILGAENLLSEGSVVLMANHNHWTDPIYMVVAYKKRQIHFMAKEEFFRFKPLGALINYLGSFAVNRGEADITSLKKALGYLRKQEILGIFPEGTRNRTEELLLEFKDGATLIAYKGKASIVPMGIVNAKNCLAFWRPAPKIIIGKPIYFENIESLTTAEIVAKYTDISKKSVADLIIELNQKLN